MGLSEKKSIAGRNEIDFFSSAWKGFGDTFLKKRVYCVSAVLKSSKTSGKPYVLFHLKDAKGVFFSAFLFNPGEDLEKKAFQVSSFRSQFLCISGDVGEFNGEVTYYLFEVDVMKEPGNLENFLGSEEQSLEFLEQFNKKMRETLGGEECSADLPWAMASLPQVLGGRIGGFSRLAKEVMEDLFRFFEVARLDDETRRLWLTVFRKSLTQLFAFYSVPDETVLLRARRILQLQRTVLAMQDEQAEVLYWDILLSMFGVSAAETVLGVVLQTALTSFKKRYEMANAQTLLLVGHAYQSTCGTLKTPI